MPSEGPSLGSTGQLALDLLNTLRIQGGRTTDELAAPGALIAWLDAAGLLDAPERGAVARPLPVARILLGEAQRLRSDVASLVEAHRSGAAPQAHVIHALNRILASGPTHMVLVSRDGRSALGEHEAGAAPLAALAPIARSAASLLVHAAPDRIRRCGDDRCGRWFLDTSKGGRRKWCSMSTCGNRAKAARYRRRAAGG
jgi:predicted RNA-binding Zn ribbon-like protein